MYLLSLIWLDTDGFFTYKGGDKPDVYDDGRPGENLFHQNNIFNTVKGAKITGADNIEIIGKINSAL